MFAVAAIRTAVDDVTLQRRQMAQGAALVVLGIHAAVALVSAQQMPNQDVFNAVTSSNLRSLESRLDAMERQDLPSRLRVVEENVGETKWLVRGVAGAFVVQIVSKLLENRRKRDGED